MQNMRVCARIHTDAIRHNFNEIKKLLPSSAKIMPVIKADAYGHDMLTFANLLKNEADYFAVATLQEAVELRKNKVDIPVLILGHTFSQEYEEAIKNDIILTVISYEDAVCISHTAVKLGKTALIHIKVDTGMSRIGFMPNEESADIVKRISLLENITIDGVFTHFSTADEKDKSFTQIQIEKFFEFTQKLGGDYIRHCGNSAAIMQHSSAYFDMLRPGIVLYGLYPSGEVDKSVLKLMPVMELESHVALVKTIEKGAAISYGRTFVAEKEMKIATIPVGYADGYPRLLSNKGRVIINGKYAPIVGRICMDQFMVDVTDMDVSVGDKVTLMGNQGKCCISAEEIAQYAQTINYEIVTCIGKRVPREVVE
ncbi:MAG: alanine racemase [Clostridia bacterium]|nr:alanine racemase [Clostridia bacterium]